LQDFAFAMMVGIFSGTYSSIFIASPVLTAWKEREPSYVRRRERLEDADGKVPAFADEVEMAKLEPEPEAADGGEPAAEPVPREAAVATAEPSEAAGGDGGDPATNGEPPAVDPAEAERAERNERRRERRRQQRRKHGRNR